MDYKTLLHFHQLDTPIETINPFIDFAESKDAHLNIVVIAAISPPPASVYGAIPDDFWAKRYQKYFGEVDERVDEVEKLVQKSGISATVVGECQEFAMVESTVARHALYADLTIMSHEGLIGDDLASRIFSGAIFDTSQPVLVLRDDVVAVPETPRVLVGWDSGPEASKAVHNSIPMLEAGSEVHIAVIDPVLSNGNPHPGTDIASYLTRHGLEVSVHQLTSGGRPIDQVLAQKAMDIDADIIVMGAYGHSRFREWLLGGTTRDILQKPPLPIFMSH